LHKDSLGSKQLIQPGQVNLMTAGGGIAHSEESQPDTTLHGVQLWIALPEGERNRPADFIHYPNIPVINHDGLNIYLLAGELLGKTAPVKVYSPLTGMDIHAVKDTTTTIPLNPAYEYGILPLIGHIELENETVDQEAFMYLGAGRSELNIHVPQDARILIIGGKPFDEEILVWWNFVARTTEEIVTAADQWNNHERFGEVIGYEGGRLTAPTPTVNLK
jgi:redox-sensitive bicupin YhaK (pirin superfamily)